MLSDLRQFHGVEVGKPNANRTPSDLLFMTV